MTLGVTLPGLRAVVDRPPPAPEPLRTDVAVFAGPTRRGPVGVAEAVDGWREFRARYGGLDAGSATGYSVRAYFDNGGEVAWILRLAAAGAMPAIGRWKVGKLQADGTWDAGSPARGAFAAVEYDVVATSPGTWANGATVTFRYRAEGLRGSPEVDVRVVVPGEPPEVFDRLEPREMGAALAASAWVRLVPVGDEVPESATADRGPAALTWVVTLGGGADAPPGVTDYLAACPVLSELPEPALVVTPDLHADVAGPADRAAVLERLARDAAALLDRLVLVDVPPEAGAAQDAVAWVGDLRAALGDPVLQRAVAVYHPPTVFNDPLGGVVAPQRAVPPAGPVAGVASRLDRERGAHHTPANATVYEAVDLAVTYPEQEELLLHGAGINLLRCTPGRGVQVWGGRTLDRDRPGTFVAHRRLIHRLVRAIHRVAQPLVFDTNGPELWFALARGITTVLLEAFRSGGLAGAVPEEAFLVQCDEELNPPEQRDAGQVLCMISVAPATPMEFITLRLTFGLQGQLEVVEA